jgi:hypothetical protein
VSDLVIREATLQDEAEILRMMRGLTEHEPGKIQFDKLLNCIVERDIRITTDF